jgi:hypothetical protein
MRSDDLPEAARAAYRAAVERDPKDAALWYRLALRERPTYGTAERADAAERSARAIRYLENAAKADPGDPAPLLLLASVRLFRTPFDNLFVYSRRAPDRADQAPEKLIEEARQPANRDAGKAALAYLERANLLPAAGYRLRYRPAVPRALAGAWEYRGDMIFLDLGDSASLRSTARGVCGYAMLLSAEGDAAGARRAAQAVVTLGTHLIRDWPVRPKTRGGGEDSDVLLGTGLAQIGYTALRDVLRAAGDGAGADRAEGDRLALKAKLDAWQEAWHEAFRDSAAEHY